MYLSLPAQALEKKEPFFCESASGIINSKYPSAFSRPRTSWHIFSLYKGTLRPAVLSKSIVVVVLLQTFVCRYLVNKFPGGSGGRTGILSGDQHGSKQARRNALPGLRGREYNLVFVQGTIFPPLYRHLSHLCRISSHVEKRELVVFITLGKSKVERGIFNLSSTLPLRATSTTSQQLDRETDEHTLNPAIVDSHLVPGAGRRNYTGFITKTIVYSAALVVFLAAFGLTLAAIAIPRWVTYLSETASGERFHFSYGLHLRCSSLTGSCDPFPQYDDCEGANRSFCSMWRTVGFLMSFAVVLEGMTLIAYLVIFAGGKQKRETGWRILTSLLILLTLVQCASMALVSYLYDNDERFYPGWKLDSSWVMCTLSWCLALISAASIFWSAHALPSEGGYELIPDHS